MTRNGSTACADATDAQLWDIAGSDLAEILRGQLVEANPGRRRDEIEDAIQAAYLAAETAREPFADRGALYRWLRTAAEYRISRAQRKGRWEVPWDFEADEEAEQLVGVGPSAEELVIERERERQRRQLVDAILPALSGRQRDVLALHVRDYKRPQIASCLGLSRRVVQRELISIMRIARHEVGQLAGGGCASGEALVLRRACGLASPMESVRACSHIAECDECDGFADRLDVWRDLAAALPVPAGAQADSGRFVEGFAALRQHVADAASSAKQQAVGAYYRTADPTPLTGARPGAAAAVIASCLTIGTAGVCVTQGVAPWTAATGLIASEPERKPDPPRQPPPTPAPEAPQVDPPAPASTPAPAPQVTPAPKPEPPPPPAPPEADVEPSSPSYASGSSSSSSSEFVPGSSSSAPSAPAPSAADAEFGGP